MAAVGTGSVRLRPSPRSSSTVDCAPSTPAPSTVASTPTPPPTPLVSSTPASSTLDSTALALPTLSSVRLMPRPTATGATDGTTATLAGGRLEPWILWMGQPWILWMGPQLRPQVGLQPLVINRENKGFPDP